MLREVHIKGFRGLSELTLTGLGRINLLVGTNNCGKTSILEAINLLLSPGEPWSVWSTLYQRGEDAEPSRRVESEMDVGHLFEGHEPELGRTIEIEGRNDVRDMSLNIQLVAAKKGDAPPSQGPTPPSPIGLNLTWSVLKGALHIPLSRGNGLAPDAAQPRQLRGRRNPDMTTVRFVPTQSLRAMEIVSLLESVALRQEEGLVIEALKVIDSKIERIASVGSRSAARYGGYSDLYRGGVIAKLGTFEQPVPFGSLGDGMWRMLGIALSLAQAKGGVLLIDEIDTGLHYTVMAKMWRLVYDAAKRFDVQVFATTHSRDCYMSFATIAPKESPDKTEMTIQRIERGHSKSVAFTDDEIRLAAKSGTEVR